MFHKKSFIAAATLLLFKPGFVSVMPEFSYLDSFINIARLFLIAFVVLSLFVERVLRLDDTLKVLLLVLLGEAWKIISTFLNGNGMDGWGTMLNTIGQALFVYTAIRTDSKAFFQGTSAVLGCYVLLNLLSILVFPNGMYTTSVYTQNYFLSYRTAWLPVYFTTAAVVLIHAVEYPGQYSMQWAILVVASMFLSLLIVWSATGLVTLSLAAAACALWVFHKQSKAISMRMLILVEGVLFFGLILFQIQETFSFLLVDVLQKDITLTARIRIWNNALQLIREHFWIGMGDMSVEQTRAVLGWGASHAHNYYLNTQMHYGLVGIANWLLMLHYSTRKMQKNRRQPYVYVLTAVYLAMLTAFQVEAYMSIGYYLYPIYLISAYLGTEKERSGKHDWPGHPLPG